MERMRVIGWMVFVNGEPATYSPRTQRLWRGGAYGHPYLFPSRAKAAGAIKRTKGFVENYSCCWNDAEYKVYGVIGEPRPE